jgi:O-antigen ligase
MNAWGNKITWGSKAAVLLLGIYVVVVPNISLVPSLESYNEKRALQISLLLVGGGILVVSRATRQQWLAGFREIPSLARWGLGTVLGLGLLSAALAPAPSEGLLGVGHHVLLFALAGTTALIVRRSSEKAKWFILGTVVTSALVYAVYFAVRYGGTLAFPELEVGRETIGAFANIRFFNQYQTWTLPILVGSVIALPKQWRVAKSIVFTLAALWWTLVFGSNVRGTVLAMAVGTVGAWLLFESRARRWIAVQVASMAAGGVLYFFLFYLGGEVTPQVAERLKDIGEGGRPHYWRKCLNMAWTHPWLGAGPMHYAWPPNNFTSGAHPHSAFFQWLAEWGVPSTTIMSSLAVWGGWSWMKQERDATAGDEKAGDEDLLPEVGVALVASVLAGASHAMVSGLIVMPVSQVLLAVVGGWAWGRYNLISGRVMSGPSHQMHHAILRAVVLGAMFTVGAAAQDLAMTEERRKAYLEAVDRNSLSPRYWTQGYIGVHDSSVIEQARRDR